MDIRQGDVFWITPNELNGIESDHAHPHVVIQVNAHDTLTVCALTSNLKRAKEPGNVLLDENEAGLPKQSVVVSARASIINKSQAGERIGMLTEQKVNQVLAGIQFLEYMTRHHEKEVSL